MSAGAKRAHASFWLLGAPDSLVQQSHREPDGTGLGWFDEQGHAQVRKQAIAAYEDAAFAREAKEVCSSTFVAHIRFASTGSVQARNTHPFEQEGRLFAHNGVIEDLPKLEQHLGDAMALVHGDTDSERLFALITREAGREGTVEAGIETACRWVAENLPLYAINLLLVGERDLWALRYPLTHELYVLEREAGAALEQSSSLGSRVHSEHGASEPLVVLASERMDSDPGWRALSSGELLHVDGELRVSRRQILHGPPAQALTLADLGGRARSSQAPASGR